MISGLENKVTLSKQKQFKFKNHHDGHAQL